jgi:hypothetical protein
MTGTWLVLLGGLGPVLRQKVKRLQAEIHSRNETLHEKNLELDALHYVWCDGGCIDGVHRYSDETFTEEVVLQAEYQARRLRRKWEVMRWQIENWPTLPSTQSEWHRARVERLKQKIAYRRGPGGESG